MYNINGSELIKCVIPTQNSSIHCTSLSASNKKKGHMYTKTTEKGRRLAQRMRKEQIANCTISQTLTLTFYITNYNSLKCEPGFITTSRAVITVSLYH